MNTKIEYLYRDADNYKMWNEAVVEGEITPEQIEQIMDCLEDGEHFIPNQVGLEEMRFSNVDPQSDHCWFELYPDGFSQTDKKPDSGMDVETLISNFLAAKGKWDESASLLEWP